MAGRDFGELVFERLRQRGLLLSVAERMLPFRPTVGQCPRPWSRARRVRPRRGRRCRPPSKGTSRWVLREREVSSGGGSPGAPACCRADRRQYAISGAGHVDAEPSVRAHTRDECRCGATSPAVMLGNVGRRQVTKVASGSLRVARRAARGGCGGFRETGTHTRMGWGPRPSASVRFHDLRHTCGDISC